MKNKIRLQLLITILILAVLPMAASYFLANEVVMRSLNLGFNPAIPKLIERHQERLRDLKRLKAFDEQTLKREFDESRELQTVYQDSDAVKLALSRSLFIYFIGGVSLALVFALIAAALIGKSISRRFSRTVDELMQRREKVNYLETVNQWQGMAQKLAHEIKGPLTPIELLVSGLPRSFETKDRGAFEKELNEAKRIVGEEVGHLRKMVQHFSGFAKLPNAKLAPVNLVSFLENYAALYEKTWPRLELKLLLEAADREVLAQIDAGLFRQVLTNLINNAVEANPDRQIQVAITLKHLQNRFQLEIANSGVSISPEIRARIFDVYFSTKKNHENMGLGLSIVKKVIVEHGGSICCIEQNEGAAFLIDLPEFSV